MKKKILSILVALGLMVALTPTAVFAATEGAVGTTFSGNDTPDVLVECGATLTPQSEATINVTVTDADGLADIASIVLKLYYDSDTTAATEVEFEAMTTANAETLAYITWTAGGDFVLSEETGSTWSMGSGTAPATLADPFVFKITPSKVATEALNSGTACWQIAALVTDDQSATGYGSDASRAAMNWYGDITVNTASADFGIEVPGTVFADATVGNISMTYIANGAYDEKVKVATDAFTGGTGTVTVDVTDFNATEANEIAFMADDDATTADSVGVDASGAVIDNSGTITEETGDTVATNSLWLQISSGYSATGVKTGNIFFVIASGS